MKGILVVLAAAVLMTVPAMAQTAGATSQGATKMKTMSASGTVKSVAADSLVVTDKTGKDWTFTVDATTKVIAKGASHTSADKKAAGEPMTITDAVKEGEKVTVKYHEMDGKMHAASVRVI